MTSLLVQLLRNGRRAIGWGWSWSDNKTAVGVYFFKYKRTLDENAGGRYN